MISRDEERTNMNGKTETWDRTGIDRAMAILDEMFVWADDGTDTGTVFMALNLYGDVEARVDRLREAIKSIYAVT